MKKMIGLICFILLTSTLIGCGTNNRDSQSSGKTQSSINMSTATLDANGRYKNEVIEKDFKLTIYSDKLVYTSDDVIKVDAELTYIGDLAEISIGHAMYPVGWNMYEHTRDIHIYGAMPAPYVVTTFKKDEPITYELTGIGEYSDSDKKEVINLNKAAMSMDLLKGTYTITAIASFHIDDEQVTEKTLYNIQSEITIEVKK